MLASFLGMFILFAAANSATIVQEYPEGYIYYEHPTKMGPVEERGITVKPVSAFRFNNVVRQAYDYSCGSAALTTVLNHYLGRQFQERQIMEGLLRFGETDKIVARRGFSMLDFKRLAQALGHPSGGFKAQFEDLKTLDHPAIVPIEYGGFKHFVVLRKYEDGHLYVADPALGNISFTEEKFREIWKRQVLFIVFPNGFEPQPDLELSEYDLRRVDESTIRAVAMQEFGQFTPVLENQADRAASLERVLLEEDDGTKAIKAIPLRTYYRRR